jgi:hypothetical protein
VGRPDVRLKVKGGRLKVEGERKKRGWKEERLEAWRMAGGKDKGRLLRRPL